MEYCYPHVTPFAFRYFGRFKEMLFTILNIMYKSSKITPPNRRSPTTRYPQVPFGKKRGLPFGKIPISFVSVSACVNLPKRGGNRFFSVFKCFEGLNGRIKLKKRNCKFFRLYFLVRRLTSEKKGSHEPNLAQKV